MVLESSFQGKLQMQVLQSLEEFLFMRNVSYMYAKIAGRLNCQAMYQALKFRCCPAIIAFFKGLTEISLYTIILITTDTAASITAAK